MTATVEPAKRYVEPTPDDIDRIASMHGDALRMLERQATASDALDRKISELLRFSLAGLGAALAISTFLVDRMPSTAHWTLPAATFSLIATGAALNIWSAMELLDGWGGWRRQQPSRREVPHPEWISDKARKGNWPTWEYHTALIHAAKKAYRSNDREARRVVTARRRGVRTLVLAGAAYGISALVIIAAALFL
jgi:hypothetical protein